MGIKRKIISQFGKIYLEMKGVKTGSAVVMYGLPRVNIVNGARIIIGNNVALCSTSDGNPLGVNHRVILSAIRSDSEIIIGSDTGISGTTIAAAKSVKIGSNCLIGANVTITDYDFHSVKPEGRRYNTNTEDIGCSSVVIEDNVWLGMNVIVLKGVRIGQNSIIAAGSIVTKSIPSNCIAGGNPAKILKEVSNKE